MTYFAFLLLLSSSAFSADLIIRSKLKVESIKAQFQTNMISQTKIEVLSKDLGLYSVHFPDFMSAKELKSESIKIRKIPGIVYASKNSFLKKRERVLNPDLWSFISSNKFSSKAESAWETFGEPKVNKLGSEVVVGIVEATQAGKHRFLNHAYWQNKFEIAGNGIDDDKNGYVDDKSGVNAISEGHTTHVAGIIASKEHGLAKSVKILSVGYHVFDEQDTTVGAIKGYEYMMAMKRRWFLTKGVQGANIVAINSSFGLDREKCMSPEFVVWNDIYNELGQLGIVSVVATTNETIDVDVFGDIPSTCTSPYVIAVGNIDSKGQSQGGQGQLHVDLFAQGTDILSTVLREDTEQMTGTSMATPHVAAGVGYLHLIAPLSFQKLYMTEPLKAAYHLKNVILNSTNRHGIHKGMNAESGVFNIFNASKLLHGQSIQRYNF